MIGTVLGNRYRLEELIGEGGMALVYKAECSVLARPVAVKILRPQFAADAEFVERFRREAQAAARLSHPNIVTVYDVGQDKGLNYIVMEYVPGENLKEIIKREAPFTVARALNIARQICEALHHAHQHNIIHRDIKPHNIIITPEGLVKVTDFGIARAVSASTLTQDGAVLGSVQYFSPEQAKGAPVGVASDLYSLGCVLYEMLTGSVPFKGESPIAIALKHIQEDPAPLREFRPGIPATVENLVARALAKDPALRFPSALAMLRAIKAATGEEVTPAAPPDLPT
ncbi:MAG: Stk1 family PASTA domain-containing Ser/Thr kinase, partial [Firmicutes bacterium]|nr:Stk1 family PASTA domain-containing Ser/Thr kinase [Bacillota bacterium]